MAGGGAGEGFQDRLQARRPGPRRRQRHDRGRVAFALDDRPWRQILLAAAIQGAIFAVVTAEALLRDWRLDELVAAEMLQVL